MIGNKNISTAKTAITLANASMIVTKIISKIAGNDISNSLNGSPVNRELVGAIVQPIFRNKLLNNK